MTTRRTFGRQASGHYNARFGIWPQQAAGLRALRKPRGVKGFDRLVGVYDGEAAGMDTEGGRWQTVCEIHSHIISHETLQIALDWASHSDEWCDGCQARLANSTSNN